MSTWKTFKLMALVLVAALVLPNVAMAAEGGKAISQESNSYTERRRMASRSTSTKSLMTLFLYLGRMNGRWCLSSTMLKEILLIR